MVSSSDGYTRKELSLDWKAKNPHSLIDFFSSPTFRIKNIKLKETCEDIRSIGTTILLLISFK